MTTAAAAIPDTRQRHLLVCYHFFHPDEVVSARMFSDLAVEQRRRGWRVTALTSNRLWRDPHQLLPSRESWAGVDIQRVFRPPFDQARPLQRLANSAWMTAGWLGRALAIRRFDAVVIGSDPAFAALLAVPLRRVLPRTAIVHWCFDLYPEAVYAEGLGSSTTKLAKVTESLMGAAYRSCDAIVDIGSGMRARLDRYGGGWQSETITPWALVEPPTILVPDPIERERLFAGAKLALLYAGTMGRAHDFTAFLDLARRCRARSGNAIRLCFACRGNRHDELRAAVRPDDSNVTLVPFADEAQLQARLQSADIHLLSLRPEWAGVVVPSKFFASLAVGRPVLYAGPPTSEIAQWIAENDVGMTLGNSETNAAVERLHQFLGKPESLADWQQNALRTYRARFSKSISNDRWNDLLRALVAMKA